MSEAVELAAKALWTRERDAILARIKAGKVSASMSGIEYFGGDYEDTFEGAKEQYRATARVVIEAIREPGADVVAAGEASQPGSIEIRGRDYALADLIDVDDIWAGMIDAILRQPA